MNKMINESTTDRIIRVVAGLILLALSIGGVVTGTFGTVLIVLGAILVLTGTIGFCPLYAMLRIRTNHGQN